MLYSPRYGERWSRHWMDVWRYSDWAGWASSATAPHIWHWRDWIVESLNEDKPTTAWSSRCWRRTKLPGA